MNPSISTTWIASQVPTDVHHGLVQMGRVVAPEPTAALYASLHEPEPYGGLHVTRDLRYGPHPRHLLDLFRPDLVEDLRPILVFLHGGAFMRGDRRVGDGPFNDNIAVWAARHGMVGVNMTYRLAPEHAWPAAQHDLRDAMQWLVAHAAEWGGDATRIVLMGHSAGAAHVAQYLAFPEFHPQGGVGAKAAVLLSGIFDPATAENNPPLRAYFGADVSRYPSMSAVPGLLASPVPLFIAYAELDPEDFARQSEQLAMDLRACGIVHHSCRLQGHSHMSEIFAINTTDHALTSLLEEFLQGAGSWHWIVYRPPAALESGLQLSRA